ncbi:MAG: hypothetical protein NZ853_02295 [Leptospiraceae bacterium]|nr:hypothetical protein [Leptospiraceae bacterium]MDW7975009.1 hypothetical protein [Leptospiraceae bacterium]
MKRDIYIPKQTFPWNFVFLSFVFSFLVMLLVNINLFRIYEIENPLREEKTIFYIINIFSRDFEEDDEVIAKKNGIVIAGKILIKGPAIIEIKNDRILYNNQVQFFKNPLPKVIMKNQTIQLNENEFYLQSEITLDSFLMGKITREEIIGKILFSF